MPGPITLLHLNGDQSYAHDDAEIVTYEWSVKAPPGSQSTFIPSAAFPNPTFEMAAPGTYTFLLHVWASTGAPSCIPAKHEVHNSACHPNLRVELVWNTPGDLDMFDEGPEAGADLDLHFLHPWALESSPQDGWFDQPFDCFWFNAHPDWGSSDPAAPDNPDLDPDDVDGWGPENIHLDYPEELPYVVGVHSSNDHGYGPSYATVRVYLHSELKFEVADVALVEGDLWEVCRIHGTSGTVELATDDWGALKITPAYPNLFSATE